MPVSKYVFGVDAESFYVVNWRCPPNAAKAFLRSWVGQLGAWLQHVRIEPVPLPFGGRMVKGSRNIHQWGTFARLYQGFCVICFRGTAAFFCRRLKVLHGDWIITVFGWIDYYHVRVFLGQGLLSVSKNSQTRKFEPKEFPCKHKEKRLLL